MRKVLGTYKWLKRAISAVQRWYDAVLCFVTRRSVYFTALGAVVFTTFLLALVTGQKLYGMIAIFLATITALLVNGEIRRSRSSRNRGLEIADRSAEPKHASKRVSKFIHHNANVERFEWEKREHPISLIDIRPGIDWFKKGLESRWYWRFWFPGLFTIAILVIGYGATHNVIAALVLLLLVGFGLRLLEWHRRYLVLTTRRYIALRGVAKVRRLQVRLDKMQDFKVEIPWHSTVLWYVGLIGARYGTLVVAVAGDENEELKRTPWFPYIDFIEAVLTDLTLNPWKPPAEAESSSDL